LAPGESGAKDTLTAQLLPGAIGDAETQFWVDVNGPVTATLLTCKGAVPVLVTVTVLGLLGVPAGCEPNIRLDGEMDMFGAVAVPVKT
jgi:hypothetical protein